MFGPRKPAKWNDPDILREMLFDLYAMVYNELDPEPHSLEAYVRPEHQATARILTRYFWTQRLGAKAETEAGHG